MIENILGLLAFAWLIWFFLNFAMMVIVAICVKPKQPSFNGFQICIPAWVLGVLNPEEVQAIIVHEQGHKAAWHVWENFLATCFFVGPSDDRRRQQEIEADDYAAELGHARQLASALRKLSKSKCDLDRAERLLRHYC